MLYSEIDDAYKNMDGGGGGFSESDNYTSTYGKEGADVDYLYWDNSKLATSPTKNQKTVLTHRDCINCYFNPNDPNFQSSLKHIDSCSLCKKELSTMGNLGNLGQYSQVQQIQPMNTTKSTNELISDYLVTDKADKMKLNDKMDNIIQYLFQTRQSQQQSVPVSNNYGNNQIENFGSVGGKYMVECNFTNIAIVVLIVLLLIDIILRFGK